MSDDSAAVQEISNLLTGNTGGSNDSNNPETTEPLEEEAIEPQAQPEAEEVEFNEEAIEESSESEESEPFYEIVVDGESRQVTLDELKTNYSKGENYTRKTQEIAEQRRQFEQAKQDYAERVQALNQFAYQLNQEPTVPEPQIDWESLRHNDPMQYIIEKDAARDREQVRQQRQAQLDAIKQEQQYLAEQRHQEYLESERQQLVSIIPAWQDNEVAASEKRELREFAKKQYNLTDNDLSGATDHRLVKILYDAFQANKQKNLGKKSLQQSTESPVKTVRSRGRTTNLLASSYQSNLKKAMGNLKKSGKDADATRVIELMLSNNKR